VQGGGADEEGILEMAEKSVQAILGNRQALGFQGVVEFLDAEWSARAAEQVALEQAEGDGIGDAVPLNDIPQDGDIHVSLKELAAVADCDALGIWKSAFRQVFAEGVFQRGTGGLFRYRGPAR
jgi:hypothetical protein